MIVLIGGYGYVGTAFRKELSRRNIPYVTVTRSMFDCGDVSKLSSFIRESQATFLINAAGYTGKPNVDACERDKEACLFGNAVLPGRIAMACSVAGIPWGHVSSGCIFTGAKPEGSGFEECDPPNFTFRQNNCSFYSGTKALGEEVLSDESSVYIWRLRIPFDCIDSPRNYLSKLMRYDRLLDATNSISHLNDFVNACIETWSSKVPFGIYNITNPGTVTTREVVGFIRESRICEKDYHFFESEAEFNQVAAITPRSNCILSTEKLASVGVVLRPVTEAIIDSLKNWQRA